MGAHNRPLARSWGIVGCLALVACALALAQGELSAAKTATCLPDVSLTDAHGEPFTPASLKGKVVLVSFIHSTCPDMCDLVVDKFAQIAKKLGPELGSQVALLSVTNDPENDRPQQLLEMARKHHADINGWVFATGSPKAVAEVLRCYGLSLKKEANGEPEHIAQVFLVDPQGLKVRQYWGVVVKAQKVVADINRLLQRTRLSSSASASASSH
jgi:protein SCO1/2